MFGFFSVGLCSSFFPLANMLRFVSKQSRQTTIIRAERSMIKVRFLVFCWIIIGLLVFICNGLMQGMIQGHSVPSLGQGRLCSQAQQCQPQSR
jgi:hypothetical protein